MNSPPTLRQIVFELNPRGWKFDAATWWWIFERDGQQVASMNPDLLAEVEALPYLEDLMLERGLPLPGGPMLPEGALDNAGVEWQRIQTELLYRIGALTLCGYPVRFMDPKEGEEPYAPPTIVFGSYW